MEDLILSDITRNSAWFFCVNYEEVKLFNKYLLLNDYYGLGILLTAVFGEYPEKTIAACPQRDYVPVY